MSTPNQDLRQALTEVSASSAGGAPFLIAYGLTFLITGVLSFFLSREIVALIAMFQGGISLPLAFWLERRLGSTRMSADNPLRILSGQMAISQALIPPALHRRCLLDRGPARLPARQTDRGPRRLT